MIVALGFCHKDYLAAEKLFRWMEELSGPQAHHSLLLMASHGMKPDAVAIVGKAAKAAFETVRMRMTFKPDERGWPLSANTLFFTTYRELQKLQQPYFLWMEPDCVPLQADWLDLLEQEYMQQGKPFMGCVYERPFPHLTGCAIYPSQIATYNQEIIRSGHRMAWDVVNPGQTIKHAHNTSLFQHEWGNHKHNIAPSFPTHASLKLLRPGAVLFHRCKDGSLIDRLRERNQWPKYSRIMAAIGNSSNRFQDFEDHDWDNLKFK